jgi:agmatinase
VSYGKLYLTPSPSVTNTIPGKKPVVKILGAPFDATSTYRSGSRFGPNAIRDAFLNMEIYSHRLNVDLEVLSVEDIGNLRQTANVGEMMKSIGDVVSEIISDGFTSAILGGEHTITYGASTAISSDATLIIFDAHLDLRDEYADLKLSHTTFLRRLVEKRHIDSIVHVGARAATAEEWRFVNEIGLKIIPCEVISSYQRPEAQLKHILKNTSSVYVSIDLDVLDPAYAPAVGNPEPAGLSTHQMLDFLYTLQGKRILGFDIVELTPHYDNGATAAVAAKFLTELTCLTSISGLETT